MAEEVVDIVHKLSFEVEGNGLSDATKAISINIQGIAQLEKQLSELNTTLAQLNKENAEGRKQIADAINKTQKALDKENSSLDKNLNKNKQVQQQLQKELGLLGRMKTELEDLRKKRDAAFDEKQVRQYTNEIAALERRMNRLTSPNGGGIFGQLRGGIMQGLGIGAGFGIVGLISGAVSGIKDIITDASRLAAEAEGVERAFSRLNRPDLLADLRVATKGTVSDLELMKQAVQFNNFGLPIEMLGTALEFARRRAAETGQSIDYLVQSIVTGIGRQSPLILDNLGINAKRVSDEFKRTGDFAQAASNIIREELEKSGADVDTFAQKIASLNAQLQNQKALLGTVVNEFAEYAGAFGMDFIDQFFTGGFGAGGNVKRLREVKAALAEQQKEHKLHATEVSVVYENFFKKYVDDFKNADLVARKEIEKQATEQLARWGDIDPSMAGVYSGVLNKLQEEFKKFAVNVNKITVDQLKTSGLSLEELQELQKRVADSRNALTSGDTQQIASLNKVATEIKRQIDLISGANTRKLVSTKESEKPFLVIPDESSKELKALFDFEKQLRDIEQIYDRVFTRAISPAARAAGLDPDAFTRLGALDGQGVPTAPLSESGARTQRLDIEIAQNRRKRDAEAEEERKKLKDRRSQELQEYSAYFSDIVNMAADAWSQVIAMEQAALDREISIRQERVRLALEVADRGNTEALKREQEALNQAYMQQRKYAQQQQAINSALAVSNAILAVAKAAGQSGVGALATVPAVIAAIIAGYGVATSMTRNTMDGLGNYWTGGFTPEGGKYKPVGVVHAGEYVANQEKTRKYRPVLEAIDKGTFPVMTAVPQAVRTQEVEFATRQELGILASKLDGVTAAIGSLSFTAENRVDENGVSQLVRTSLNRRKRQWS